MEIFIKGKQGEGKSIVANFISQFLIENGLQCSIEDGDNCCKYENEGLLKILNGRIVTIKVVDTDGQMGA